MVLTNCSVEQLPARLRALAAAWSDPIGSRDAPRFIDELLAAYGVHRRPGALFEQHPIRIDGHIEVIDLYIPGACIWSIHDEPHRSFLEAHHERLLACWSRVMTRYMVLCDFDELWIYDTGEPDGQLAPRIKLSLKDLPAYPEVLQFLHGEPFDLPGHAERLTARLAARLGRLMCDIIDGGPPQPHAQAQAVVLECVFAMFAEHTGQIAAGRFTRALARARDHGDTREVWALLDELRGDSSGLTRPPLTDEQLGDLFHAARDFPWAHVRPVIFGTIFEHALDPGLRHDLGAYFTCEADIMRVVGPTVVAPWRARIAEIQTAADADRVVAQMQGFHVLDPACGCGDFLYVVYREMKRLAAALARRWSELHGGELATGRWFTREQLHGIEIDGLAAQLARIVLRLGDHLASRELGLDDTTLPILSKDFDRMVRHDDALFVDWPRPAGELAIVGNPPYLGVRKLRRALGDERVEQLFARYPNNRAADYATYWFTRALEVLRPGERAGYVCTNSIAQNESREASIDLVLAAGGTLTDAWRSYPWPGEAAVHIAIVNWVMSAWDGVRTLEGKQVLSISPGLTEAVDVTVARPIVKNAGLCFMGVTPGNEGFVLGDEQRAELLENDPTSKAVILPYLIGRDVSREPDQRPARWIIDFATMEKPDAQTYSGAFRHVQRHVYSSKHSQSDRKTDAEKSRWWQFVRPRPQMRAAIARLKHVLVIPCAAPHLLVSRQPNTSCFDHQLMVIALSESYHLGVLQSRLHAIWAWARGSTLKGDLRYTNTTIFETFPFPPLSSTRYDPSVRPAGKAADLVAKTADAFDRARSAACTQQGLGLTKIHNQLATDTTSPLHDAYDALNDAVTACYGFPPGVWRDEHETLKLLLQLNHRLAALTGP